MTRVLGVAPLCAVWMVLAINLAWAQSPQNGGGVSADEQQIRQMVSSYVDAFNKHDAKALADFWSPDAVYQNRSTGEQVTGRAAIADQFAATFKTHPELKLQVTVESVQFVSPNVAVERGQAKLITSGAEPEEFTYSAVDVKRDGKWLLDRVTDTAKEPASPSHYEQLKVLEWMVGQWTTEAENAEVDVDCNWTKNKNFLTRAFKISIGEEYEFSGMQIIGWDASAKQIRSWTFDSNGTFAEATWEQRKGNWFIRNRGVLPDGRAATMINVMKQSGENAFSWQTIERTAGGELLPNIDEIAIVRR